VCGKRGDPCDSLCGGAGCGVCGGLSCEHGAVTKADRALGVAKDAEKAIREKETGAEELLRGVMLLLLSVSQKSCLVKSYMLECLFYCEA